jgi:deazaflavin-dependent oxidoreductase (nitroreductase family)
VTERENQFLYLTTKGWRSGKPHQIEIWFVEFEEKYYVVSGGGRKSHWIQNSIRDPKVSYKVAGKRFEGSARVISHKKEPSLAEQVAAGMKAKYGWGDGLILELSRANA